MGGGRFHIRELRRAERGVLRRSGKTAGIDGVVPRRRTLEEHDLCHQLLRPMNNGTYSYSRLLQTTPFSGGKLRTVMVPVFQDRVVLGALNRRLRGAHRYSKRVLCRPGGQDPRRAVGRVLHGLRAGEMTFVATLDIKAAFPSLPVARALDMLRSRGADRRAVQLLELFFEQSWPGRDGAPLGAAPSSLLLDVFLGKFDKVMGGAGARYHRYVDDVLLVAPDHGTLSHAIKKALDALPAPLVFKPPTLIQEKPIIFLGWGLSRDGSWWPARGRWARLEEALLYAAAGTTEKLTCWLHQHPLESMEPEELAARLPGWRKINSVNDQRDSGLERPSPAIPRRPAREASHEAPGGATEPRAASHGDGALPTSGDDSATSTPGGSVTTPGDSCAVATDLEHLSGISVADKERRQ